MTKKVYVDSSVIGGKYDPEFQEPTERLLREFKMGLYIPVLSSITADEMQNAPAQIVQMYHDLVELGEVIEVS